MNSKRFFEYAASILGDMDKGSKYTVGHNDKYFILRNGEDELDSPEWFEYISDVDIINYILELKGIDVNELEDNNGEN